MSSPPSLLGMDVPTELGIESQLQREAIQARLFGGDVAPVRVGRFVLLEPLGRGGMGMVYAAYDPQLDRRVAVKVLHPMRAHGDNALLLREAQAMAKLVHPNVITVHEAGEEGDAVFIAMELVQGETLREWGIANPPGTRARFDRLLDLAIQAASGLVAAHEAGLVHRDLKPANLLVGADGRLRVADFGLARAHASSAAVLTDVRDVDGATSEPSRIGAAGTPAYMPPEQFEGKADARSDQWSLCATLWEVAYGERAFAGDSVGSLIDAHRGPPPRPPSSRAEVPTWFRDALLRGLAVDPERRHPDARTLLRDLERGRRRSTRRGWWAAGIAAALLVPTIAFGLAPDRELCPTAAAEVEALWDPARRDRVKATFVATARAHAPATFSLVSAQIDERARAIGTMRRESCEATRGGQQSDTMLDLRSSCLDARSRQLEATLARWEQAIEPAALDSASQVMPSLSSLVACADAEQLRAAYPPPDAEHAAEVDALQRELDEAEAATRSSKDADLPARAESLAARAEAVDYPPVVARALRLRGRTEVFADPQRALKTYEAASKAARTARDVENEFGAWIGLVGALESMQRPAEAQWALSAAEAVLERVDADPQWRLNLAHSRSVNALARGDSPAAVVFAQQALELARAIEDPPGPGVGRALHQLGDTMAARGDTRDAIDRFREALTVLLPAFGEEHPMIGVTRLQLGTLLLEVGEIEEGEHEVEAARTIWVDVLGEQHPHVAGATLILSRAAASRGENELALKQLDRAIAIFETIGGPNLALAISNRGLVLRAAGRFEESERDQLRSLKIRETAFGPMHPDVAESLTNLGNLAFVRNDFATALDHHRRSLAIKREAFDADAPEIAGALVNLAMTELALKRWDDAYEHDAEAMAILQGKVPAGDHHLALAYAGGGEAALERGQKAEAIAWLAASLRDDPGGEQPVAAGRIRELLDRAVRLP